MPDRYLVAIVGRPNVGKSALFNRIIGASSSIVHSQSGVTRDRLYAEAEWQGEEFTLLDTGGLDLASKEDLTGSIRAQVNQAIKEADALLFVVDLRAGLTTEDIEVAELLRKTAKPLLLAANKADTAQHDSKIADFYGLGFADVYPVSAMHGLGIGDLLDRILELKASARDEVLEADLDRIEAVGDDEEGIGDSEAEPGDIRITIAGKPNVGKSSLTNALLGDERMTVSAVPGTTVDAVDTPFRWEGTDFVLVDTAGLRRPKVIGEKLEELSVGRALTAIKRSHVVILVLDGNDRPSAQERRIAGYIRRNGKASVIAVNKLDLGLWSDVTKAQYKAAALYACRPIDYSEVLFVSALTKAGINRILPEVLRTYEEYGKRIETSLLNQAVTEIVTMSPPPKEAKFYYATQVGVRPPHMVFFVKDPAKVSDMYKRYLDGELRKRFGFKGTPIVMEFKERQRKRRR
jgi:GTP-binding protein